jgi:AraC-like DNA-binding protein
VLAPDWEAPLSNDQFFAVYLACITELTEYTARRESRPPMTKTEHDLLCHCVISCRTLREVIARAAQFCTVLGERSAAIELSVEAGTAEFRLATFQRRRDAVALYGDLTGLAAFYRLFSWLLDEPIPLIEAAVCYPQVIEPEVASFLLPFPLTYDAPCNLLRFPADYLDRPVVRTPGELERLLRHFPFDVDDTRSDHVPVMERLRALIGAALAERAPLPTGATLARRLNMSPATLKRRLMGEGMTLRGVKDQMLCAMAVDMLRDGALSVDRISHRLNFSDATSFSRAFKRWTGHAPAAYQRLLAASPVPGVTSSDTRRRSPARTRP